MTSPEAHTLQSFLRIASPLVSVVITSYKKADTLRECILSFLNQTYPLIEIIIVNDGSPDHTSQIVRQLQAEYPRRRLELIEKTNGGVADARNVGFRHAQGRLFLTMDGDDLAEPELIRTGVEALRSTDANLFYTDQQNFGAQNDVWKPHHYDSYLLRYDNLFPTPSLFDAELFNLTGGFKLGLGFCEDWEFWLSCSRHELRPIRGPQPLIRYRVTQEGLAHRFVNGRWHDCAVLLVLANQDLYSVEEVLESISHFSSSDPHSIERCVLLRSLHPTDLLLRYLNALILESQGKKQEALAEYEVALQFSQERWWPALFSMAMCILGEQSDTQRHEWAFYLLHRARTYRPDLRRYVSPMIENRSMKSS
jgi:glycosyltransferase involved in cell wall biosynthesis